MKRFLSAVAALALLTVAGPALAAFDPYEEITVISREDGSGTRGAFVELLDIIVKDETGEKFDMTMDEAIITNSTSVVMNGVAGDEVAIGYISLGSLSDRVKALAVDGAPATTEAIKAGEYKVSRPFNIATREGLSGAARDFIDFILSADGQAIAEDNRYIAAVDDPAPYTGSASGKIVVSGSSSVTPVMEKLKEAYLALNSNAEIELQQSDSTTGMRSVIDGIADIGMASRALTESELAAGLEPTVIALDGIAVIVNHANPADGLSSETIRQIFTGEVLTWAEAGVE